MSEVAPDISWSNNQSGNAWIFDTTEFGEKFTAILRDALSVNQLWSISDTMQKSIDSIRDMSDQTLAASLMTFNDNTPMIENENAYVRALCYQITVRKQQLTHNSV